MIPFLPCDAADKEHIWLVRIDSEAFERGRRLDALIFLEVDPVVDDVQPARDERRKDARRRLRLAGDGDDRIGHLDERFSPASSVKSYPPPSCSRFHGRSGSSECTVITSGMP